MKFIDIINEELTDNEIKKCKLIWRLYKTGEIMYNDKKYMYVLNDYRRIIRVPSNPDPIIEVEGNSYDNLSVYRMDDDGHQVYMRYDLHNTLNGHIRGIVRNKFHKHNIHLSI